MILQKHPSSTVGEIHRFQTLLLLLVFSFSFSVISVAQCPDSELEDGLIDYESGKNDILKAVGTWKSNCSVVFFKTSDNLDAPAYLLMNGHCLDLANKEGNLILIDEEPDDEDFAEFNYFINTSDETVRVYAERIEYATMKDLDIAIIRLEKTVREMMELGLEPIKVAQKEPQLGDEVKIVGVPRVPHSLDQWLRLTSCSLSGKSPLVLENGWVWRNMFENECSDIIPGSSGSPVFRCFDEGFYGLINTTNAGIEYPCELASPCEVNGFREEFDPETNYALDIRQVVDCFNDQGFFDTSLPDFPYGLENQLILDYFEMHISKGMSTANQINPELENSNKNLEINLSGRKYYRYKFESLLESSPWEIAGFGEVLDLEANKMIDDEIPLEEGVYFLSIISGDTPEYDASWQGVDEASVIPVIVDKTPPTVSPDIYDTGASEEDYVVETFVPSGVHLQLQRASGSVNFNENDLSLYTGFNITMPIRLDKNGGPYKVCGFFYDNTLNMGPINCEEFGVKTDTDDPQIADQVIVYPNPTSGAIHIKVEDNMQINKIEIYDLLGKQVYRTTNKKSNVIRIEDQGFASGMYVLQLKTDQGLINKRVIFH